jgi:hypothetical protein
LIIGESEGTGVSPTAEGIAAGALGATVARTSQAAKANGMGFMTRSYLRWHSESVSPPKGISLVISRPESVLAGAQRRHSPGVALARSPEKVAAGLTSAQRPIDG